jgi:uncharacterized protein with HEPN domain
MSAKPVGVEERLHDIVKWGESATRHLGKMDANQFLRDEKTQHAVIKCIESIGEAAKEVLKAVPDFGDKHPDLKLKAAARMRDRLTHGYRDIDLGLVWTTAKTAVPATVAAVKGALAEMSVKPPKPPWASSED